MNTYDVQISRVVKMTFVNIEASTAEEAALLADGRAKGVTDCIVRGKVALPENSGQNLKPGALLSIRDADINTEVLVDRVHFGAPVRDARFVQSQRIGIEDLASELTP